MAPSSFTDITPYQYISGSDLTSWRLQNSGFWLTADKVQFANTLTGTLDQVSNADLTGHQVCETLQQQPSLSNMAELNLQIESNLAGRNCDVDMKVDLSLTVEDDMNLLPSFAMNQGIAIYDTTGNWLGNLQSSQKSETELVPVLSLLRPSLCAANTINLVDFVNATDTWSAQQYEDGSLLLRIANKVYHLSSAETLNFVLQQNDYALPETPLYTFPSFSDEDWLIMKGDYLYYSQQQSASLFSYKISSKVLSLAQPFLNDVVAPESSETFSGFKKLAVDDESLWVEGMFTIAVDLLDDAGDPVLDADGANVKTTQYWHRFKRLDLVTQAWDEVAALDHLAESQSSRSLWYSINNKAYVKIRESNTLLFRRSQPIGYVADHLLTPNTAPLAVEKIWHFLQLEAHYNEDDNAVLAVDYSDVSGAITLELMRDSGVITNFADYSSDAFSFNMGILQGDYLPVTEISCTTDCLDSSLTYKVNALNTADGSVLNLDSSE